jgi:hypothetical protein
MSRSKNLHSAAMQHGFGTHSEASNLRTNLKVSAHKSPRAKRKVCFTYLPVLGPWSNHFVGSVAKSGLGALSKLTITPVFAALFLLTS